MSAVFFTIATKSYLAHARVLLERVKRYHPEAARCLVLVDKPEGFFDPDSEDFSIVQLSSIIPKRQFREMSGYYTAYELCNAAKPFAHEYFLARQGAAMTIYLDSDIFLLAPLETAIAEVGEHPFLITPHLLSPDLDFKEKELESIMIWCGIYNGGFIIVRSCDESLSFLEWWKKRLRFDCIHSFGLREVDQSWLNFAPALFPKARVSRNPALNIGYWNLFERQLSLDASQNILTRRQLAVFFHFSGWNYRKPEEVTRHRVTKHEMDADERAAWAFLSSSYTKLLYGAGVKQASGWPYSFDKAENGSQITAEMRRAFLELSRSGQVVQSIFENPSLYTTQIQDSKMPPKVLNRLFGIRKAVRQWFAVSEKH
jgi:hypothetical protein